MGRVLCYAIGFPQSAVSNWPVKGSRLVLAGLPFKFRSITLNRDEPKTQTSL